MDVTNMTSTRRLGWQKKCQTWAAAGESFEVHGVGARELNFCRQLCAAYNYECRFDSSDENSAAIFGPLTG